MLLLYLWQGGDLDLQKEGYMVPKPCIQVNGHYMVDRALKCLPKTNATILGALTRHKDLLPLEDYGYVVWMDEVLPGQAAPKDCK